MEIKDNEATTALTENDQTLDTGVLCNGTGTHDDIVMESSGVTDTDCPDYVEDDDVRDSIAEGYF